MPDEETIDLLVEGGKAAPGPATAPKLGAYKLNIGEVFQKVNEATAAYKGMQVPVKIIIDKKAKKFRVEVGTPPISSLIKKELGLEKAKTKAAEEAEKAAAEAQAARATGVAKPVAGAAGTAGEAKPEVGKAKVEVGKAKVAEDVEEAENAGTEEAEAPEAAKIEEAVIEQPVEKVREVIANLKMEQVVKIAKVKMDSLLAKDLKSAVKMVLGTANSMMGIQIEGKWPKEVIKDVDEGKWDGVIK